MINNTGPIRYMPCTNETHVRIVKERIPMPDGIEGGRNGRGERGREGVRGLDVSNEYLIANPRHFQRIPRVCRTNAGLSRQRGAPRMFANRCHAVFLLTHLYDHHTVSLNISRQTFYKISFKLSLYYHKR